MNDNPFRHLPAVDELTSEMEGTVPRALLTDVVRGVLERARRDIGEGRTVDVRQMARDEVSSLRRVVGSRVVNATGVLLHTNLGRALWSESAVRRATEAAANYTNLELDLDSGDRHRRGDYPRLLLRSLTGAEDAHIVNNNASAVLLALAATSAGKAVPTSRGELIEIGGSYRLPAVMEASGARLIEVGTTNRTRAGDFETALQLHDCGAILKVHPSNYRIEGFASEAGVEELAGLARAHGVPLLHDIGSGLLDLSAPFLDGPARSWLREEPAAKQSLQAGADLVMFSGDKLLGGPQAGIIVGRAEWIDRLRDHPLSRALRVDGVTLAALGATLESFASGRVREIPFWNMALTTYDELKQRATRLATRVGGTVVEGASTIGAGSVPGVAIPSPIVRLEAEDHLYQPLLRSDPPVLARRERGSLVIDLRTVDPADDDEIADRIVECR